MYKEIYNGVITKTKELTRKTTIIEHSVNVAHKYQLLTKAYAKVHSLVGVTTPLTESDISDIDDKISKYMRLYRSTFPNSTVTVKQHLLEHHVVPFLRNYPFGLNFFGEQGGESIHAKFNIIKRRMTSGQNNVNRLLFSVHDYQTLLSHVITKLHEGNSK